MTNSEFEQELEKITAEYRNDFSYLSEYRFELLCMSAGDNSNYNVMGDESTNEEYLALYAGSLEGFTSYTREEIEEIC